MLREVKRIQEHVGFVPDLTGALLDELPRYNTGRYKGFLEFCKENGFQTPG